MPRIKQLSPQMINQIAAGEVIERPASAVKELLENSVDALATRIDVQIAAGGLELLRVVDDGEGIEPDDLALAVASHATSKLTTADDLFRVRTLGFRGEALASIAEVSRFRIRSRPADQELGRELRVELGAVGEVQTCGCPAGTLVEAADLFANIPVRRKFLKSVSTEFGHISEQFTRVALAHPRLHLTLEHNGRMVYQLPATEQLLERVELFFGRDFAKQLIAVESELDGVRVWGYVGHPALSKATRKGQYLFLNGRWITDRTLQHALNEAYRGLLMVGRHPVLLLFVELAPDQVDVNVHPTKAEVRFREGQKLYRQLLSTLRNRFLSLDLNSSLRIPALAGAPAGLALRPEQQRVLGELADWARGATANWTHADTGLLADTEARVVTPADTAALSGVVWEADLRTAGERLPPGPPFDPEVRLTSESFPGLVPGSALDRSPDSARPHAASLDEPLPADHRFAPVDIPADWPESAPGAQPPQRPAADGPAFDPAAIGGAPTSRPAANGVGMVRAMQVHDAYLVLETDDGLSVVDQHALHERILYEHLRKRVLAGSVESQRLLIPEPVELSSADAALVLEHAELLRQFGLQVEPFGGGTVVVTAYPVLLRRSDPAAVLRDVVDRLQEAGGRIARRDLLDSLLHMMACKAAVKAGQRLAPEEIDSLLQQRHLIDDSHHCPHGRPTALVLSRAELDRQFGRLG